MSDVFERVAKLREAEAELARLEAQQQAATLNSEKTRAQFERKQLLS